MRTGIAAAAMFLALGGAGRSATYHVAANGEDQRDGLTEATAIKTIAAAVSKARSGDKVLLRRGDVFRESASFGGGIELDAYGSGERPVVSGSARVSGWALHQGQVYVADYDTVPGYLYVDNALMRVARYPNTGWLRTRSWTENGDGTNTVITTESLANHPRSASGYWNGANIRWHRHSWWFETRKVAAFTSPGTIALEGKSVIHIMPYDMDGWGFYLDNKLGELDTAGEWYYDAAARKIYLWAPGGGDPDDRTVEVSARDNGLSVGTGPVRNLCFRHQKSNGLRVGGKATVEWCLLEGIGSDDGGSALQATWGAGGTVVRHCVFRNNLNLGISWNENPAGGGASVIEYDTLVNTGTVDGYGGTGTWHAAGIVIPNATNLRIQHNRIDGTGYAGIVLGSDGCFAEYNIISRAMATLNDGGAIYTNCSRSTIRHNIITETRGGMESSGPWANLAHGIWPEFLGDFRENVIENNTCAHNGGFGLFMPNNFASTVRGNVFYDNGRAGMELSGELTNSRTGRTQNLPQGNAFESNVFYATADSQAALLYRQEYDYGTMADNYLCNPWRDKVIREWGTGNQQWSTTWLDIATWQAKYGWTDKQAKTDLIVRPAGALANELRGTSRLATNATAARAEVALGDDGVYLTLDGDTVVGSVTLESYRSAVLVHTGERRPGAVSTPPHGSFGAARGVWVTGRRTVTVRHAGSATEVRIVLVAPTGRTVWRSASRRITPGYNTFCIDSDAVPCAGHYLCLVEPTGVRPVPASRATLSLVR